MQVKQKINEEFKKLNENSNKTFNLCLIFACIILFVYCYFGTFSFFEKTFPNAENLAYFKIIYHNLMCFLLFFGAGLLFTKFVVKSSPKNFGLKKPANKWGWYLILIALPIAVLCGVVSAFDSGMSATYPMINFNVYGSWYFIAVYFLSYFLYYVGWEYLFRGMLLFPAEEKCGALGAILITTLVSALIHTSIAGFGKPLAETLSAIPAGLIFGYIAHKTKSIYPTLFIHFLIGVCTDIFVFII